MFKFLLFFCVTTIVVHSSEGENIESINHHEEGNFNFLEIPSKVGITYNGTIRCSGVIISPRHVLTLQSCISDQRKVKTTRRNAKKMKGSKNYYTTFMPDEYLKVDCNSKLYNIKIMKSHKFVRPRGHTWKIYVDHVAVIELEQKLDKSNFSSSKIFGPRVKSNEYVRFVPLLADENKIAVKEYIRTTHKGICRDYTDVVFYDIVCGLIRGHKNYPCKVYPGDPIFDDSMRVVGLMKDSYTSMNKSIPIQFLSLYQHVSWLKKFVNTCTILK